MGTILASLQQTTEAAPASQIPVLTTPNGEFQPARNSTALAWEQNTAGKPNHYDVMLQPDGGSPVQVNRPGSAGAMGDFAGDRVVYQQYRGTPSTRRGRSDLYFFDPASGARSKVPAVNTKRWEYWPSLSGDWVLFGRLKRNHVRLLFLQNLVTGERRRLDRTKGENRFIGPGQVNGNYAVWYTCRSRCQVFRYDIASQTRVMLPNPGRFQRAPSVAPGGTVYFSRGGKRCGQSVSLVRQTLEGEPEVLVQLQQPLDVRDTYVHTARNGTIEVYYERNGCGRKAASDIYKIVELALATLTVDRAGTGGGTVTSSPSGINCGNDCSEEFEVGTVVGLTASPLEGQVFVGWSGACEGTGTCQVTLGASEEVAAIFLPRGSITIRKEAIPEVAQDFTFRPSANLFPTDFILDDDADPSRPDQIVFSNLETATYSIRELPVGGWALPNISCIGGGSDTDGNAATRTATIGLDPGEAVACTFTNDRLEGTIVVRKQTIPSGAAGSFTFSGTASGLISDGGQIMVSNLQPGLYTATETDPSPAFDLVNISCDDGNSSGDVPTRTATFRVEAGETVRCTFLNDRREGTVIVEKRTNPPGGGPFTFTGTAAGTILDGDTITVNGLAPGSYSSTESDPSPAFSLSAISCVDSLAANSSGNLETRTASFELEAGETVRCTFTNDALPPPP